MTFQDELATDIWSNETFRHEYFRLASMNISRQLNVRSASVSSDDRANDSDDMEINHLLQSALIFASSNKDEYRDAAQRISTSIRQMFTKDELGVGELFALIQARLRNFPALVTSEQKAPVTPSHFPLALQFEFAAGLADQSVKTSDGAHVLTDFQLASWRNLEARHSTMLTAPTSAGKSYVILLYILERLKARENATVVYLVPTRALITQVAQDMSDHIKRWSIADVTVSVIPVDVSEPHRPIVYVLTQERLQALLISSPRFKIDVMVIDEAQIIERGSRGVLLEAVVDKVLDINPNAQVIFSGPIISNPEYFGELFNIPEFTQSKTLQSPVTQNTIFLSYSASPKSRVSIGIDVLGKSRIVDDVDLAITLTTDADKLSYISATFGKGGSSLVYASGPANAEKIALKISGEIAEGAKHVDLTELIEFVKRHVHEDYSLVSTLETGVAFHYGNMPPILRREIEQQFKARRIAFLVCTSTLLYGLNLPAKNIFMLKPKTGKSTSISGPDFWNLAGRVGRLGKELEGNVFLIDYETWKTNPIKQDRSLKVESALNIAINKREGLDLLEYISDTGVASAKSPEFETVLGKLLTDERIDKLPRTLARYTSENNSNYITKLSARVQKVSSEVQIPFDVLNQSIGVSPFRQVDLLKYFSQKLQNASPRELIPSHPLNDFMQALESYRSAFKVIHTFLLKYRAEDRRHFFFAALALKWMRGDSLRQLIHAAIEYNEKESARIGSSVKLKSRAFIIRETMDNVEESLRFTYVKFFTCYNALLALALSDSGKGEYVQSIPNVPLFLEMGASSGSMISLMAIGLSRTTAEALNTYITNKDMSVEQTRAWLKRQAFERFDISPICIREINLTVGRS